jgi:uncharacterized membrane protein (UPF0127 family)
MKNKKIIKKKLYKFLFLAALLFFISYIFIYYIIKPHYDVVEYNLEGKKYRFYLSDNVDKWQRGLMYIKKLKDVDGLLFVFPERDYRVFYNKNTYLDIDIYWIDGSSVVGKNFLPSIKKSKKIIYITSPQKVDKVVELVRKE